MGRVLKTLEGKWTAQVEQAHSSTSTLRASQQLSTMFSRVIAITLTALPLLAVATPLEARNAPPSCSTGALQCCDSTEKVSLVGRPD